MEKQLRRCDDEPRRDWEGLRPEIMALILAGFPTDEVARVVPFVCRSWRRSVTLPDCWAKVDIEEWCRRCDEPRKIDFSLMRLLRKSNGVVQMLSVFKISDVAFPYVTRFGRCLKVLNMPMSTVTDEKVEKIGQSLNSLTTLDISHCLKITSKGIEAFGNHCKSLIYFKRNMPLPEFDPIKQVSVMKVEESEATAVANSMTGLHHLELGYGCFSDIGLDVILSKCRKLVNLNIQGCWNVKLEGSLEERCNRIQYFRTPWDDEYDDYESDDESSQYDDSSDG